MNKKLLSIIVPIYNVQGYLHDCINSLLEQNIDSELYEIILINDGSKDKSKEIIDRYSEMYKNIRVFHFQNNGLGATRNKGIKLAKGKYIAFLDSDDFVPKNAYGNLLESAEHNNADVVTSPVERFEDGKYTRSGLHKKVDFTPKIGTTLNETLSLLYDTTSTNKIYNLSFLKANNLYFPENVVYEDIYFTMSVYAKSTKINTIEDVTYIWRIRTGETISISQDRFNIQSYKDRLKVCLDTLNYFKNNTKKNIQIEFEKKIMVFDIPLFFPEYQNTDEIYTQEFINLTRNILPKLDDTLILYCDYRKQVIYRAIKNNDVKLVLNYSQDHVKTMKLWNENGVTATDKYLERKYVENINFNHSEILKTKVRSVDLIKKKINILVNIYSPLLEKIDIQYIKVFIFNEKSEKEVSISNIHTTLFEIKLNLSDIPNFEAEGLNKIKIVYKKDELFTEKILSEPGASKNKTTLYKKQYPNNYKVDYTFGWDLFIKKQNIETIFHKVSIEKDKLIIETEKIDANSVFKLKNYKEQTIVGHTLNNQIIFNLNEIPKNDRFFELSVLKNGLLSFNYTFRKKPEAFHFINMNETYEYVLRVHNNHSISINKKGRHSQIRSLEYQRNKLVILYKSPYTDEKVTSKLTLKSTNGKVSKNFDGHKIGNGLYKVIINLDTNNMNEFLTYGTYIFSVNYYIKDKLLPHSLLLNESKKLKLPYSFKHKNRTYDFFSKNGYLIYLKKGQILNKLYDNKKKRDLIYNYLYPIFRLLPKKRNKIVYYSYWGDQYACSPKAIYQYLNTKKKNFKNIWILNDINMPIEGNPIKIKKNSLKYWYHLATSKYFIQNTNMPVWYKKRKGQLELQTFHGTFMKTMGFDTPEFKFETRKKKIDEFQKKVNNWDYVSVPSNYMGDKALSAFNTNVKLIKHGFPRNDMIFKALNYTENIKSKLNIPNDKKIVLYAPTWREETSSDINLDINAMQKELGDSYILLIRAHYMVSNNMDIRENYPFAIDVSNYPSIEELYTISDVLITDYSSVMFDYAYLKRPMLFYAYDLEKYIHGERGVYLDYEKIVPGPVVRKTSEIILNLNKLEDLESKYKNKYDLFYNKFCQYGQSGNSSKNVINQIMDSN
ncbi:bifunctional glycosyltransferase/CDP-glycerol:glycerophosphate glycerophosphotransferase [Staphylococcus equorum]|uniref:bifunctional glycosyltransferase/CDP-glycerol:glycerophosphate glycerophosphotransferase n=2 Tax=Staphylococcus equorum TaxID=246432 RepID=UPI0021BE07AE|nr:bifunctional glycosyltransferase/CDP-glycerol:glycerophosphate glycerophosphotransferase [Staphylococcus equorum]